MSLEELKDLRDRINNSPSLNESEKKARLEIVQAVIESGIVQTERNNQMGEFLQKAVELGKIRGNFGIPDKLELNEDIMKSIIKESDLMKYLEEERKLDSFEFDDLKYLLSEYESVKGKDLPDVGLAIQEIEIINNMKELDKKQSGILSSKLGTLLGSNLVVDYNEKSVLKEDGKTIFKQDKKSEEQLAQDYQEALEKIDELYVNEGLLDTQTKSMATNMLNQLYSYYKNGNQKVPIALYEEMLSSDKTL